MNERKSRGDERDDALAMIGVRGDESPLARLEPREIEVFTRMAQGQTNLEIVEAMGLSPKTISLTSQTIKDKLGIHRPAEITRLAVKHWVIGPSQVTHFKYLI